MSTRDVIGQQRAYLFKIKRQLEQSLDEIDRAIRELQHNCHGNGHVMQECVRKDGTMVEQCAVCWISKERAARPSDETLDKTWVQTCRFCNKDIYGGGPSGDAYWHMDTGKVACDPLSDLSKLGTTTALPIDFGETE